MIGFSKNRWLPEIMELRTIRQSENIDYPKKPFPFVIEWYIHIFSKSWRIVVSICFCISKCFQNRIRIQKLIFYFVWLITCFCISYSLYRFSNWNSANRNEPPLCQPIRRQGYWHLFENSPEIYCIIILLDSVFPLPDSPVIKMHFYLVFMSFMTH